ncbi:hypothetical protein [Thalassobacillus sp. CUG 92003]|uniref:hypothetical protein n=1 Tax=Thalassobacillus sp. CUG 92003 TaxID=2736641 RepID=UPI0015E766FA|nr:hypothetical protein [Thalassobacillus sp. CUG 92003]
MKKKGQYAKVAMQVDGTPVDVLELREWSISVSSEKIDANVAGEDWADHVIGRYSWEGEATCVSADQFWLKHITKKLTIDFFDDANDAEPSYQGTASIDFEHSTTHDDLIENSLTFTGAGELTSPAEDAQTSS